MSENTSQGRLDVLLPAWEAQLQLWARNGSLVAAAQDALVLNGTPDALQALIDQWSAGDFSGLPPIVLLSASDISGAMGAYAISTGTIYLNQDWLLGASADQANAVLTEELGHHLDGLLNAVDTQGDEGSIIAKILLKGSISGLEMQGLRSEDDSGVVNLGGISVAVEQATIAPPTVELIDYFGSPISSMREGVDALVRIGQGYEGLLQVYWRLESSSGSKISSMDFQGSKTTTQQGQGVIGSGGVIDFTLTPSMDKSTEGTEYRQISLYSDSTYTTKIAASAITAIVDSSRNYDPYVIYTTSSAGWVSNEVGTISLDPKGGVTATGSYTNLNSTQQAALAGGGFVKIFAGGYGNYAAQRSDGSVLVFGYSVNSNSTQASIISTLLANKVIDIRFNDYAGAAKLSNGTTLTWGHSGYYADALAQLGTSLHPNLAPQDIYFSSQYIPAKSTSGSIISTLHSDDPNSGSVFRYSLVPGVGDTDNSFFSLSGTYGDTLVIKGAPTKSTYSIRLRSTDQGGLTTEKSFLIGVGGTVNLAPTSVSLVNPLASIAENSDTSTAVKIADISITDDSAGINTISLSGQDAASFVVTGNSIYLRSGIVLDYEAKGSYAITVNAFDATLLSSSSVSTTYTLPVLNVQEGPGSSTPILSSTPGVFREGATLLAGAITGDPDGNGTITRYQWYLEGSAITGATSSSYVTTPKGVGGYRVDLTYTDGQGYSTTVSSGVQSVVLFDNGQGILAAISGNGAFQEGVTLSAGAITGDPDGAGTPTAYQWYLNGAAIGGATASSYAVGANGAGTYKVAVTYADAQGFSATLISADQTVAKVDNGQGSLAAIAGNGAFNEGVTLSAGAITGDPDGAATPTAYQWYLNGAAISGATASTYAVNSTAYGTYKVAVTYADAQGFSATLTSADQTVAKIDNGQGSLAAITGNGAFQEGVTLSAGAITGDPDGAATPTAYQWYLNGSAISGATSAAYAVNSTAYGTYKVAVTYADAQGFSSTLTSADQLVAKVDNGQGSLAAITGNGAFQEGVTLSAGAITGDPDGAATPTAYQWYLNGSAISGATSAAYAVNSTAYGTYKVAVTYADAQGFSATLTSADQTVAKIDNGQGIVGITGTTTVGSVLSATAVSGDPEGLASAPAYSYTWLRNGSVISGAISSNYTLASADLGSQISVRVGYTDGQGYAASATSASTVPISSPLDTVSPTVTAMAVQGSTISLTFSEPITGTSLTAANYVVAVAATPRTISAISLDATANNKLLLTLSGTAPTATQSLTVAYALPAGNPSSGIVTDLAGNPLQTFTTRPVDTFVSTSAIGSSSSPLQADYINATLTGSSRVNVYGNAQNNTINGNDANNALYGAAGNDSIKGNGGNDSLYGGAGVDSLTGGLGSDAFYFDSKPATFSTTNVDHVTDFNANQSDKISFGKSAYGFTSTSISLLTISSSTQLSTALASTNVFIYDGSQGLLYWNQNGATSGAGTGGIVAVLDAQAGIYPLLAASNLAIA